MSRPAPPSRSRMLLRGLAKRCPWCSRGRLFSGWFRLAERCPRCGLRFEREEGAFLGSLALNYGVTGLLFIALLVGWLVATLPDLEIVPLMVAGLAVAVGVPLAFYPFAKTIWAAIDLLMHDVNPADPASLKRTFGIWGDPPLS